MPWGTLKEHYTRLCMRVLLARFQYYVQARPVLSDFEYDKLEDELRELEAEHPELKHPKSPITVPGSEVAEEYPRSVRAFANKPR